MVFSTVYYSSIVFTRTRGPQENHVTLITVPKWGARNGNHMNDDVAEENGSTTPMLPGSFLYKKESGYKAIDINMLKIFSVRAMYGKTV